MARPSTSAALRKELRAKIIARMKQLGRRGPAAAKALGMTGAQCSRLLANEDLFSLDRLVDAAVRIGFAVHVIATRPYGDERAGSRSSAKGRSSNPAA